MCMFVCPAYLAGHDLGVGATVADTSVEASQNMRISNRSTENVVRADTAIIWTWNKHRKDNFKAVIDAPPRHDMKSGAIKETFNLNK